MHRFLTVTSLLFVYSSFSTILVTAAEKHGTYAVGVAQIDITPTYPIRLSGFGFRRDESEGVTQTIWAKALAISTDVQSVPVVLITVDNLGIPASMHAEVARRLKEKSGLSPHQLAIAASHTHTAPMLHGIAPTLFGQPIPGDQQQRIDQYTRELTDHLESVALAAIKDRQPARMSWGIGSVKFAINRRTKGGPVDHDLPILVVKRTDGSIRAICVNYACHCVTLSNNKISGDWAGYAQDLIQREFPTAIGMVAIGCGADQNPSSGVTGDKVEIALQQGAQISAEVKRLVNGFLAPINGEIMSKSESLSLAFADPPSRAEWEEKSKKTDAEGYHARVQLERLNRGEQLQAQLPYSISSWSFGDSLAMVFLPGEVVVDYSRRLKRELDGGRLWINAYSNDAPCYIPSERVLAEGGYEALNAMYYYDRPGALQKGLEERIVGAVHRQLDEKFASPFDANKTSGTLPKSPQQSLASLETTPNLRVDLVVAEPLITDPVAIDFGADGALWVAEMHDYPEGIKDHDPQSTQSEATDRPIPGGRIRLVRDTDADGQFDRSTIFLDHIPFPTGVTVWGNGVLVCAAPDILFAEDTDGDDKADVVKKLFSGFGTSNNQARLNSLIYGVDGWIYGSCGLFGGTITNWSGEQVQLGDRDFRIRPDTGVIEAATGRTQQGRVRDDFGNWFGCDNTNLGYHYPLAENYLRRNPYIGSPPNRVHLIQTEAAGRLFPARSDAQRFQLSGPPGTVTAACGIGVYRDSVLGPEYEQNLFICEPVNLLVHRMVLTPKGSSYVAERAANENGTEFLRSTDGWFRPVQAVTGPDGALWVVDMYRFLIEDPRWIPAHELAPLDVRAGSELGRIYRVTTRDNLSPPATRFAVAKHAPSQLNQAAYDRSVAQELEIQRLEHAEGPDRQRIPQQTIDGWRKESVTKQPTLRIANLRKLAAIGQLSSHDIRNTLADGDPRLRAFGLMIAEQCRDKAELIEPILLAATDADARVRLQAACSLGQWNDLRVGAALARLALRDADDPYIVAAVFSSLTRANLQDFTKGLFAELAGKEPPTSLMAPFLATAVGLADDAAVKLALVSVSQFEEMPQAWQLNAVTNLVQSLASRTNDQAADVGVQTVIARMEDVAFEMATTESLDESQRVSAIQLLGRDRSRQSQETVRLSQLLSPAHSPAVQLASVEAFERIGSADVPGILADHYRDVSPTVQPKVLDTILSREAWYPLLFDEIARGKIPATSITAAQRQELVGHPKSTIRERAIQLLSNSMNTDRQHVVLEYQSAADMKGNPEKGRVTFAKNCSQCHRLGDVGHVVGPNLAMVANKTPAFLIQEIFDPNRNVDTRYSSYVAVTKAGLIRTGILSSESSNSITLLAAEGKQFPLLRSDLDELRATTKSLMPEGMEKELSVQAVGDLIAFLKSMPGSSKQIEGNLPVTVKSAGGSFVLEGSQAAIYGNEITFERPFGNIGFWHAPEDHVVWSVDLSKAGEFDVSMNAACDRSSAGNEYRLEIGNQVLTGIIESTGGWDNYVHTPLGRVSLSAGLNQIVLRPGGAPLRGALVDLKNLNFTRVGEQVVMADSDMSRVTTEIRTIARQILDDNLKDPDRDALIAQHPEQAAALVVAMTADMRDDAKEEYRRIPWIWRVAVACGKRDQAKQLIPLLAVSLPQQDQPLRDWQAVVIGGGIINGIGLKGGWPKARISELLGDHADLKARWKNSLTLASAMVDDEKITTGTRYDALRMIAMDDWQLRCEQLVKYLKKGVPDELQMGAISGLSDIEAKEVSQLLMSNFPHFNEENRGLAIGALLRNKARTEEMLEAIENQKFAASNLNSAQRKSLLESTDQSIRQRATRVLNE